MERRVVLTLLAGAAAAAAAAALAMKEGQGTVDAPHPPPPPQVRGREPERGAAARRLPVPLLPADFPPAARRAVESAWPAVEGGTAEEATAALAALSPVTGDSPFHGCAPAALEALAPALVALITGFPDLAVPAMKCAAAQARAGGAPGRAALAGTGLLARGFALSALSGSPALQAETAALLGFAGGDLAQELLVLLLEPVRREEVRAAAAAALGEAFPLDHRLRPEAVQGVIAGAADGEPPVLRRACLRTMDRAWEAFRPYDPGPAAAAALAHPDPGLQRAAAAFFCNHPLQAQGPDLVAAIPGAGEDVLPDLGDALRTLKPAGWKEALEARLPGIRDPQVRIALRRSLGR